MSALARELQVRRKDLYLWRDHFRAGGPEALRGPGRPRKGVGMVSAPADATPAAVPGELPAARKRIAELERKIGQQRLILIFFDEPCGKSGEHAGRAPRLARRRLRGHPSDDHPAAARPTQRRADARPGRREPRRVLPSLQRVGTAPGRHRRARHGTACGAGGEALRLSAGRHRAAQCGLCGEPQKGYYA